MQDCTHLSEAKRRLLGRYLHSGTVPLRAPGRSIVQRPSHEPAPLSLSQEQLWLRETSVPGIPALYNECITVRMAGPLNVTALERSLAEVVHRHEIWRTTYDLQNSQLVQVIHPAPGEVRLPVLDLRGRTVSTRETEARQAAESLVRERFDLKTGPLLRFRLVRTADFDHRLFICAHLSVVDGISVYQVFPSELAALYRAFVSGQRSLLPALPVQFGDYAYWQRRSLQEESRTIQLGYWKEQLGGTLPVLKWPDTGVRPRGRTFVGAIHPFMLSKTISEAVIQLSQREGVTLFMTLATAFAALMHHYTHQDDIIVGTPSPAGRKRSEVEKLLGYFLNPVALRFDLSGDLVFRELLRRTQRLTLEALSNDDIPLEVLAKEIKPSAGPSDNPFFRVAISLQPPTPSLGLEWAVTSMDVASGGAPWELYIAFINRPAGIMGRVQYNPDLFETETIARMLSDLQRVLECMTANPLQRPSQVEWRPRPCQIDMAVAGKNIN